MVRRCMKPDLVNDGWRCYTNQTRQALGEQHASYQCQHLGRLCRTSLVPSLLKFKLCTRFTALPPYISDNPPIWKDGFRGRGGRGCNLGPGSSEPKRPGRQLSCSFPGGMPAPGSLAGSFNDEPLDWNASSRLHRWRGSSIMLSRETPGALGSAQQGPPRARGSFAGPPSLGASHRIGDNDLDIFFESFQISTEDEPLYS